MNLNYELIDRAVSGHWTPHLGKEARIRRLEEGAETRITLLNLRLFPDLQVRMYFGGTSAEQCLSGPASNREAQKPWSSPPEQVSV